MEGHISSLAQIQYSSSANGDVVAHLVNQAFQAWRPTGGGGGDNDGFVAVESEPPSNGGPVERLCGIGMMFRDAIDLGDYVWSIKHWSTKWAALQGNNQVATIARTNPQALTEAKTALSSYRASGAMLCSQARKMASLMEEKLRAVIEWDQRLRDIRQDRVLNKSL
ncbi:uncharacterized protein LY79DRAFT_674422 [Colletotrichum navitas]|uniref:Uncharacterized protein n=1 Tax=Colletotrichum navitas TaxID=681940 RepID=A0AAD8UZI3_9PEZI|nr:uncharacterized protein LY79DRAFT_674422 [Colletotrichum navitas]KAK1569824.1 hypothetical protein LY79DRAFT_674422 [Colletotrichum navitas]